MSRYIKWEDVVGRYPDVAKINAADGVGSYWLNYAESEIDAALAKQYTVPFSTAPDMVKDLCIDLTYYKLTYRQKNAEALISYVNSRIGALQDGNMQLVDVAGTLLSSEALPWNSTMDHPSSFGIDDPVEWNVSSEGYPT